MGRKKISLSIEEEDYARLKSKAEYCNMSINAYIKLKVLNEKDSIALQHDGAVLMAKLYRWAELTEDLNARKNFREGGDLLCRYLK